MEITPQHQYHHPVLLEETLRLLDPREGDSYLDLTAGYGGHAEAVLKRIGEEGRATLVDRDAHAQAVLKSLFEADTRMELIKADFLSAAEQLREEGRKFSMILMDVGVSSPQVDEADRGFSFRLSGPLDMRMDQDQSLDARGIVNNYSERQLEELIRKFGEEPQARRIARAIVAARPITTTDELAAAIEQVVPRRGAHVHPATRTFQSLRIAVNNELDQLEQTLPKVLQLLEPGGRLAVISFHSLEDRIVKDFLREHATGGYDADLQLLTKKPLRGDTHDVFNPRSRSARLRAAVKINNFSP